MSFTSRFLPLEIGRRDLSLCLTGCISISLRSLNSSSTRKWVNTLKLSSDYSFTKKGKRKTNNYKYINAFSCLLAIIDPFWFDWSFKELFTKRVGYELISENNVRSSNFLAISFWQVDKQPRMYYVGFYDNPIFFRKLEKNTGQCILICWNLSLISLFSIKHTTTYQRRYIQGF